MLVEYIRYNLKTHKTDSHEETAGAFEAAYGRAATSLDASPHCLAYELTRCVEEPLRYVLRIEWTSIDGHLLGFRRAPEFKPFFEAIKGFIRDIEEMQHYMVTRVGRRKSGHNA